LEFITDLVYGCVGEASNVLNHLVVVLLEVGSDGVVGHGERQEGGERKLRGVMSGEGVATGELLKTPG
jgi:hypothetical protein